jgi:uncharacterized membrane protein
LYNPAQPIRHLNGEFADPAGIGNIFRQEARDSMDLFLITLLMAALLCTLVAGFLFAFAVVIMPGIARLDDAAYIRAFQVIDGVIQDNQPLFIFVWLGSVVALLSATVLGFGALDSSERVILVIAALVYILGVQVPTFAINIPLNNRLQSLESATMNEVDWAKERSAFEARWRGANLVRTLFSCLVAVLLVLLIAAH